MDGPTSAAAQSATRWLMDEGRKAADTNVLLAGLSDVLIRLGVPLARATTHIPTLHPQFRWVMRVWQRAAVVEELRRAHGIEVTPTFHGNTVEHVVETGRWLEYRSHDASSRRFPVLRELWKEGYTHYVMAPLGFTYGGAGAASWATAEPGGFAAEHLHLLHEIVPAFSLVLEFKGLWRELTELLGAYVGHDPTRRILAGTVQRGDIRRIPAAVMLTDLRGFGKLSDELPEQQVIELLNEHFDCIVPYVLAEGGEVLKYIGDGVLAVFGENRTNGMPCEAAYRAARAALSALSARNADRQPDGPCLRIGIALHYGEVAYGNIGSDGRLDFTAIGRDVNIVSRLEGLCKPLERSLLMTDRFASRLCAAVVELGQFEFRGFRQHETVFGLAEDEAEGQA